MGKFPGIVSITSGSVISSPAPHTEHGGKPGDGGRGAPVEAGVVGSGVGAIGGGVVGAVVGPIGEQPQGATKSATAGQMLASMKPLKPARCKSRHDIGGTSGKVIITSGSVISSPVPHTEHSGKPGDRGIGEVVGAGTGVGATGAGVVGAVVGTVDSQPQGATKPAWARQTAGSTKPRRPACSTSRHDMGELPGMVSITSGSVILSPVPHTEHGGKPGDGGTGVPGEDGATVLASC